MMRVSDDLRRSVVFIGHRGGPPHYTFTLKGTVDSSAKCNSGESRPAKACRAASALQALIYLAGNGRHGINGTSGPAARLRR